VAWSLEQILVNDKGKARMRTHALSRANRRFLRISLTQPTSVKGKEQIPIIRSDSR